MSRHRPPPPPPRFTWMAKPTAAVAAVLSTASLGILWHGTWEATAQPVTVAAPTAVELPREPSGHGGPLTPPTFADPHVWAPSKGPVIVNGQALVRPTVAAPVPVNLNDAAPVQVRAAAPEPTPAASTPTVEPEPTPVVVPEPTDEPVVTEPVITEPVETTPTETTEPTTEAPAEPTEPVVPTPPEETS